jgi:predicted MFS family arabinose efflux permease
MALAGALVMAAGVGIGRFCYTPLLPAMQTALGWTVAQAGDVASANFLGYMLGALAAAALARGAARWRWLVVGMLLSAMTTAMGGVTVAFPAWLGLRFCSGVASAFCLVLSTAIVVELLVSQARTPLGALHFSGVGGGIVISVGIIELAGRLGLSVFGQWVTLGLVSLALFAGAWGLLRRLPQRPAADGSGVSRAVSGPLPTPRVLLKLITAYGLFGFGYIVTATFIVAMARRLDAVTLVEPLTWTVFGVMAAPSVLVWQRLAGRLGMLPALRLAYGVEAAGVLLAGCAAGPVAVMVGGALLGGTFVGITALGLSAARHLAGRHQDGIIGWMTASFGLGQLLGPAVAGRLAQWTQGFVVPSLVAAVLLLVGIALLRGVEQIAPDSDPQQAGRLR